MAVVAALVGILVVVGFIAMPLMMVCALGRLRELSEELAILKSLVINQGKEVRNKSVPNVETIPHENTVCKNGLEVVDIPSSENTVHKSGLEEVDLPLPENTMHKKAEPELVEIEEVPMFGEVLIARLCDWLAVRGDYAPEGVTREFAVATRWLVRVGMTLLVGSIVYFVKLSIDNGWMGPTARVMCTLFWGAMGVAGGVALVKRTRYGLLGHALAALGLVALYLGFGLGHRYFEPPVIASWQYAFSALVGVTVAAGFVSILLPSSTLAVMGLVGGYLVPIVAGYDTGSPVGLCSYLIVLNIGACVVAQVRQWQGLNFLASLLAYVMVFGWCARHPLMRVGSPVFKGVVLLVFLSAIHALYLASAVRMAKVVGKAGRTFSWLGVALNALFYLTWLGVFLRPATSDGVTGLIFLLVVAAYLGLASKSLREGWLDSMSINLLLVFALVFLALAPLLLFPFQWCTVAWSLIAIACVEVYQRKSIKILGGLAGVLLCAVSIVGFLFGVDAYGVTVETSWCNGGPFMLRLIRVGCVPAAMFWVACRLKCRPLVVTASVMSFFYLTGEAHRLGDEYLPNLGGGTVTLVWALTASACLAGGIVRRLKPARLTGLFLLGLAVGKLLLLDTVPLAIPARVGVFAGVGLLLMVGAFLYLKFKAVFEGESEHE